MAITFNADEIFEMATRIESNGAAYYRRTAEVAKDPKTRDVLASLAVMEDDHLRRFAAMRSQLGQSKKQSSVFDPEGDAAKYLQAMADSRVFDVRVDPAKLVTGQESPQQILKTAIGLEKDSIVFYLGMRDLVPNSAGKEDIEAIIREEMAHITTLSKRLGELHA